MSAPEKAEQSDNFQVNSLFYELTIIVNSDWVQVVAVNR